MQEINIVQKAAMATEWYAANYGPVEGIFPTRSQAEEFIASVPQGCTWLSIGADDITGDYLVLGNVPFLDGCSEHAAPKY